MEFEKVLKNDGGHFCKTTYTFFLWKGIFLIGIGDSIYNKNLSLSLKSRICKSNMW